LFLCACDSDSDDDDDDDALRRAAHRAANLRDCFETKVNLIYRLIIARAKF